MLKRYFIYGLFFLLSGYGIQAQTDIVVLPDEMEVSGTLQDFQPGKAVTLLVAETGEVRTFAEGEYLRIIQLEKRKINIVPGDLSVLEQEISEAWNKKAVLHFTDGSEKRGKLLAYDRDGPIQLEGSGGFIYTFFPDRVMAITYEGGKELAKRYRSIVFAATPQPEAVYAFRERGFFQHTSFAFTFGKTKLNTNTENVIFFPNPVNNPEVQTTGFNIQHLVGFQYDRWLGLGVGVGYDAYNLEGGEGMLSVFAQYRAYLTKSIRAPYLGLSGGYGFPILAKDQGFRQSDGGFMFHPELGVRLGASEKANFTMALGYRWQSAYYVQDEPITRVILYRDVLYRRLVLNLGLVF